MLTADDFFYNSDLSEDSRQDNRCDLDTTDLTHSDDNADALSLQRSANTTSKSKKKEKKSQNKEMDKLCH